MELSITLLSNKVLPVEYIKLLGCSQNWVKTKGVYTLCLIKNAPLFKVLRVAIMFKDKVSILSVNLI